MKISIEDCFTKGDQIRRKLRIWLPLLRKSLMENFIFCAVTTCLSFLSIVYENQGLILVSKRWMSATFTAEMFLNSPTMEILTYFRFI